MAYQSYKSGKREEHQKTVREKVREQARRQVQLGYLYYSPSVVYGWPAYLSWLLWQMF